MNHIYYHNTFLQLVRLGIGTSLNVSLPETIDWSAIEALANEQGLSAIVLDGLDKLHPSSYKMSDGLKKEWIGNMYHAEVRNAIQKKAANEMASLFNHNEIRTYVLKGAVVSECYPNPVHRLSVDMDCFLLPNVGNFNAWEIGNSLIKEKGFKVETGFYKNSTFYLPGLTVENHLFLTPFRGNKKLTSLEKTLQSLLKQDTGNDMFDGSFLYRPPVMVSALFLIEHAYSHFLHEGLTWRHVLDWMMFRDKHRADIDWTEFNAYVDEFGFRKFYDAYLRLGRYLLGEFNEEELSNKEKRMMADIWAPLDLHETMHGFKGKLKLVGNTLRARWKYHYFGDISMLHALWIHMKGFIFIKNPRLD